MSGCTLLGDGSISLILDTGWLVNADINEMGRVLKKWNETALIGTVELEERCPARKISDF